MGLTRCLLILALLVTASCSRHEAGMDGGGEPHGTASSPTVPVVTARVEKKTMPVLLAAVGTVQTIATVEIASQVTGQLREVLFTPGADVRKGQPLFRLDPRPFEAALRQAEAVVARDTAQANDARAQRTRLENLFNRGLIPREQFDTQAATAAALEATLEADRAQVEQAQLNLQYTRITAPIDGRTGALLAHVGDIVRANDTNPLVTINQLSPIDVAFAVPSRFLIDIRRNAARQPLVASVTGPSATPPGAVEPGPDDSDPSAKGGVKPLSQPAARGEVTFIDNTVDPATATVTLKATFPNRDRALWPGLFVQVALQLSSQADALVVPAVAVQASQQGPYVYIVKSDRTVEMRKVAVDRQQGNEAVIAGGLQPGEEVVTEGQLRLTPGAAVTTGNEDSSTS
jgi:multidrug efflux system membrane fusion protein